MAKKTIEEIREDIRKEKELKDAFKNEHPEFFKKQKSSSVEDHCKMKSYDTLRAKRAKKLRNRLEEERDEDPEKWNEDLASGRTKHFERRNRPKR